MLEAELRPPRPLRRGPRRRRPRRPAGAARPRSRPRPSRAGATRPSPPCGQVYRDPRRHWPIYELAEKLVDLEDYFRRWRFNHVTTVERVIGLKRGTGGTGGVSYLRRMLEVVLFPELWDVRTAL